MAARYGAGQYDDAFSPHRLQNWSVTRPGRQRPSLRGGSTQIIADDRGHLLPAVPRSQASPWGTFVGTWDMPPRIPPARLDLTSRSAAAAARLMDRLRQPTTLTHACNGLRTEITGKRKAAENRGCPDAEGFPEPPAPLSHSLLFPGDRSNGASSLGRPALAPSAVPQEPRSDTQTTFFGEPSRRSRRASSEGTQPLRSPPRAPLEEPPGPGAGAVAPLSREPGCTEVRLKADASPEPPSARQPSSRQAKHGGQTPCSQQPAGTDLQCVDTSSPKTPASMYPAPREASAWQGTPLQPSAPSPGVRSGRAPGSRSPEPEA